MSFTQPEDAFVESFINYDGSFNPSICADLTQNTQIPFQRHVDIRSFIQNNISFPNGNIFMAGEDWTIVTGTAPTVGVQSAYNYHNGMSWPLSTGTNIVSSFSASIPVDIYTGFEDMNGSSFISLACPAFPSQINIASSYISFTSDPNGLYGDDSVNIYLSSSLNPTNTTDVELRFPRSALNGNGLNLTSITGVKLTLVATANCTFTCLAIRLLPSTWDVAPVDINTRLKALVPTVSKAGTLGVTNFPVAAVGGAKWPILYRQSTVTSTLNDVTTQTRFYTGQMAATSSTPNQINIYYRYIALSGVSQAALEGKTMASLNGLPQPDTTSTGQNFNALNMGTLDTFEMSYLDTLEMQQLDAIPSSITGDWLEVDLSWYNTGCTIVIKNPDTGSDVYTFPITLNADYYYLLETTVINNSVRVELYQTDSSGVIQGRILDSTVINDPSTVIDRSGLIGWWANLVDGDAKCYGINTSYTSFGDYLSTPIQSQTPVVGASIYPEATPDKVLANSLINGLYGGTVTYDVSRSPTAQKIVITGSNADTQSAQTEPFWIYDWDNTVIQFRLFAPNTIENYPLKLVLLNQDSNTIYSSFYYSTIYTNPNNVNLQIPFYSPGTWQNYTFYLEQSYAPIGYYTFNIVAPQYSQTFWVDNFLIYSRNYAWKIRDGHLNYNSTNIDWTYFLDAHDNINMGASLNDHTTTFQIAGDQLQADAQIQGLAIMPYYANRSKLTWAN